MTPSVAGDDTTGFFTPPQIAASDWTRLDAKLLAKLRDLPGLTPTASDVMDELGLPLIVSADVLQPRVPHARVVGQAVTLRYLPERRVSSQADPRGTPRLAHHVAFSTCEQGDIVIIDAGGTALASVLGGIAAHEATRSGVGGVIVYGAVRDLDEIAALGLPVWSRAVTPRTGKFRLEAVQINGPVGCGGQQVIPGDLVLADDTGVCFIPVELAERAVQRIHEVATREIRHLESTT